MAGKNGAVLFGHLLRRVGAENIGTGLRITPRLLFEEHLEHDGFRRRRYRVNRLVFLPPFVNAVLTESAASV